MLKIFSVARLKLNSSENFSFKNLFKNKIFQYIFIGILIIIILLIASTMFSGFGEEKSSNTNYSEFLEDKLIKTLSKIEGAGDVAVMVTVDSKGGQDIAVKTSSTTSNGTTETIEEPVLVNGEPIVLKEYYPKITGVLIICEGANNFSVLSKIQEATITLLNVDIKDIQILPME